MYLYAKLINMTLSLFLTYLAVTATILLIIRAFWINIIYLGIILQFLGYSFVAALFWAAFISQTSQGWVYTWAWIFLTMCGIFLVICGIAKDVIVSAASVLKSLFK